MKQFIEVLKDVIINYDYYFNGKENISEVGKQFSLDIGNRSFSLKNMKNDIEHYKQLEQMDIKVIVIWECELKECFDYRMESLLEEIKNED